LLRQLATAVDLYSAAPAETAVGVAHRLRELARTAAPGSDAQLQFVKAFAKHATTDDQLDTIEALYSGDTTLDGVDVDTDLQWEFLTALASGGRKTTADIDIQLAHDNTATGHRAAARVRAALPTAEAKDEAF